MKIFVLVVDNMFDTGLTAILDTLAMGNEFIADRGDSEPFEVTIVGVRSFVQTHLGLGVSAALATSLPHPDVVVVPALADKTPELLNAALQRPDIIEAQSVIQQWYQSGTLVTAACTGTYLLAAAGLLDGVRATTTWWLAPDFRKRFPEVILDDSQMLVVQDQRVTAGAALAHVDLALWIVRQYSQEVAQLVSRHLLIDGRPSQAVYAIANHLAHNDSLIERFQHWVRQNLTSFTMTDAANAMAVSERTLQRRCRDVLGRTPIAFVQDLRIEQAIYRLQTTDTSVEAIAEAVGYLDGVTLRTLLRKKTGCSVSELRRINK
ncbi:helix-turn-helix domain-containing protein [filamentous cyanobacterium LEGE 11480]|uniref:Helix-turn-helix domain-containing protein n=1 Tax=Romeriopsis navalis LEGE 11480 TaxID=2777977 RepID=A0A928VPM6_9CYAN|nr:helix-turn-helix domain-containing protein [Romeriopsis navalis]MBE9032376.1 helix-turn-helix domain-containing protein [Romeriopsis navalis LEGE 11480]